MEAALRQSPFLVLLLLCLWACSGPVTFPQPPERIASGQTKAPPDAPLVIVSDRLTRGHPGQTGVYPVTSAHNALAVRLAVIRAARSSIDIQYFIFRHDETGLLLTRELLRAAERGVRVRFLLDDFTTGDAGKLLLALQRHPNIQIRLFNPFPHRGPRTLELLADFRRLHRRMHNKSFTADGRVTFIGGRNLSNKYFGFDSKEHFGDLDLIAIGAVVPEITRQFDIYWNSHYSFPVQSVIHERLDPERQRQFSAELLRKAEKFLASDYGRSLLNSPVIKTLSHNANLWYWGPAHALFDPPRKVAHPPGTEGGFAGGELMRRITGARRQLIIISPYLLPGEHYLQQLIAAAERGVEVYILTNSLASSDVIFVHGAYRKYRRPLLEAGVHLYELSSALKYKLDSWHGESRSLLHAKLFAVDGQWLYVGSFNLDQRSILLNTELGLMIKSPQLTEMVSKNLIANVHKNAYQLLLRNNRIVWRRSDGAELHREPDTNWLQRMGSRLSGWLPLESLL
ncbi:phospholipase D family protein [Microbulbifer thermotolerans]|uniref:phospholipase D-like domain-containing protein n=1 Tax=Microbulbifer thermotolerans TaxID=252514 RepID=UPI002673EDBD|nr:phospholipase D family protein [Microbulbifer thermotolerans]WKT59847.1 phospholipase D family protein [Microbulbifer thermotolerans]